MKEYTTIAQRAQAEFIERKSQFIGVVAPVSTEEEAQALASILDTFRLSQEELAIKLNVVRQTISKWEQGVSHS